jgi:hypothetical protein
MITNKPTIKWGVWGAIICLATYAVGFVFRAAFPNSELAYSAWGVMIAPVLFLWKAIGVSDGAMAMALPIFISIFLFPVAVGFGIGALVHRIFVSR